MTFETAGVVPTSHHAATSERPECKTPHRCVLLVLDVRIVTSRNLPVAHSEAGGVRHPDGATGVHRRVVSEHNALYQRRRQVLDADGAAVSVLSDVAVETVSHDDELALCDDVYCAAVTFRPVVKCANTSTADEPVSRFFVWRTTSQSGNLHVQRVFTHLNSTLFTCNKRTIQADCFTAQPMSVREHVDCYIHPHFTSVFRETDMERVWHLKLNHKSPSPCFHSWVRKAQNCSVKATSLE